MKKIFITSAAVFLFMLAPLEVAPRAEGLLTGFTFFVLRLNADQQPPLAATQRSISMDFKDANLKDILKVFSMQSEMNFIASEAVQDRKVTLYLDKVPLNKAMDKIFSANNLTYELDNGANIFVVKEWGKMETETVTKVFFLKNATVSTAALKDELSKSLKISSESTVSSVRSKFKEEIEGGIGITSAVKKLLTKDLGSMMEDFRTNSIIVTDTPMKMKVISQVIASLDVAVPQVMLEVEMLDVSKDAVDKMGFEFGDTPFTAVLTGATAATGFPFGDWSKIINPAKGSLSINPSGST
ncbi:MAG: secretin N-terminal domain-containing protein, partial [Candidatus Omnitrophota bacterium]|nr:secretin N-terminal domain-containing protein [Candidatus Omnitrophota bacterium]